ncbi:RNA polymerase sigma factor [Actinopolymorpha singaporensis]|uniref:RNA polymerase sigma-70 factor, ECF subfamily n=1 Tax=Actinopolymorpha singaporensis TaxID=117157 RepID=A0A1H1MQD6_9ACTN|nr:RNA polymerase sigma factor [Actinopolymorpha singaporensis]SDR89001.1 RNA polymerase sigma-70 factor, ECF subfamily [Actinopolymorpha singaporensis]
MTDPADVEAGDVEAAVVDAHRRGWALVLAATVRVARDLDLAEECVQEAYAAALESWARDGIPDNPAAWLTTTAKRRAMDAVRRERVFRAKLPLLVEPEESEDSVDEAAMDDPFESATGDPADVVPDERLRLIFMCCHPALAQDGQLALTLRLVCGVSTGDIAHAFLVSEPTMAARLTRAKKKISAARIPFRVPEAAELPDRLRAVLGVIHLLFTAGHTAPSGGSLLRTDLVDQSLRLTRMLRSLMPDEREVWGLLALLLVTDARRATRVDGRGRLLRLEEQDRSRWDRAAIAEAHDLIVDGLRGGRPGRYVLQAAIASLYAEAPTYDQTDWPQILTLYDELLSVWPSPVVALNRTVALAMVSGPARALAEVEELGRDGRLAGYQYLSAIRADLLQRLGRVDEAAAAYRQALESTTNEAERDFLAGRLASPQRP